MYRSRSPEKSDRDSKRRKLTEERRENEDDATTQQRKSRLEMLKRMQGSASTEKEEGNDDRVEVLHDSLEHLSEDQKMSQLFGFSGFDTTKGKKVEDNHTTAARGAMSKAKRREHRQYMNRKVIRKDGAFGLAGKGKGGGGGGLGKGRR